MTPDQAATHLTDVTRDTPGTDPASAATTLNRMIDAANTRTPAAPSPHTPAGDIRPERVIAPAPALAELTTQGMSAQPSAQQLADAIRALPEPDRDNTD